MTTSAGRERIDGIAAGSPVPGLSQRRDVPSINTVALTQQKAKEMVGRYSIHGPHGSRVLAGTNIFHPIKLPKGAR
jgi:hypothetical protein